MNKIMYHIIVPKDNEKKAYVIFTTMFLYLTIILMSKGTTKKNI